VISDAICAIGCVTDFHNSERIINHLSQQSCGILNLLGNKAFNNGYKSKADKITSELQEKAEKRRG